MLTTDIQFNANYLTAPASSIVSPRKCANRPTARHSSDILRVVIPRDHVLIQTKSEERWLLPHSSQQLYKGGIGLQTHDEMPAQFLLQFSWKPPRGGGGRTAPGPASSRGTAGNAALDLLPSTPACWRAAMKAKLVFFLPVTAFAKSRLLGLSHVRVALLYVYPIHNRMDILSITG